MESVTFVSTLTGERGEGHSAVTWIREQVNVSTRASSATLHPAVAAAARQGTQSVLSRCRAGRLVSSKQLLQTYYLLWWNNLNSYKVN
jgi:hypothetical protein